MDKLCLIFTHEILSLFLPIIPHTLRICLGGGKNGEKYLWMNSMCNFTYRVHLWKISPYFYPSTKHTFGDNKNTHKIIRRLYL